MQSTCRHAFDDEGCDEGCDSFHGLVDVRMSSKLDGQTVESRLTMLRLADIFSPKLSAHTFQRRRQNPPLE